MATSLLLMATDQASGAQETKKINVESDESKTAEPTRSRGRKPSVKSQNQKKVPQRGMGVEKLERLRFQEWEKQMAEITHLDGLTIPNPPNTQTRLPFMYPTGGVPMPHGASSYGGPAMIGSAGGFLGLNPPGLVGPRGGFCGGSVQVLMDPSRVLKVQTGKVFETSKELTSIPNLPGCSRCDACFKKIRSEGIWSDKNGAISQANACDFLGLEQARNQGFKNELGGFTGKPASSPICTGHSANESVEVLAIHRKWNSQDGGRIVMEYEFFPGKDGRRTYPNALELPEEVPASVAVSGEVSYNTATTPDYLPNASNNSYGNIDLSLKL